jgi:hypothetical protein
MGGAVRDDYVAERLAKHEGAPLGEQVRAILTQTCAKAKAVDGVVVLSSESIGIGPVRLNAIRDFLTGLGAQIQTMIYLRPEAELIPSHVQQRLKSGNFPMLPPVSAHLRRAQALVDCFGSDATHMRVFSRKTLVGGDVVTDFRAWMERITGRPLPDFGEPERLNESIPAEGCALLLRVHDRIKGEAGEEAYRLASLVVQKARGKVASTKLALPEAMDRRANVLNHAAWNEMLERTEHSAAEKAALRLSAVDPTLKPLAEQDMVIWVRKGWSDDYAAALADYAEAQEGAAFERAARIIRRMMVTKTAP